jgi:hypothetical protein
MASKRRKAPGLSRDVAELVGALRSLVDPYRPELHYMRGPGPKWRAKHAPATPADTVSVPVLAHAKS